MQRLGECVAITFCAFLLPLAGGCTKNSGDQFHAYQPSNRLTEGETPAKAPTIPSSATAPSPVVATTAAKSAGPTASVKGDSKPSTPTTIPAGPASNPAANRSSAALASIGPQVIPGSPANSPLAGNSASPAGRPGSPAAALPPRKVQVLVPNKTFRTEGESLRVSYDDLDLLKVLNMDPVPADAPSYFPGWLKALDGQRIRIRGFMYPTFQQTGVHVFGLARDNQICCFGRNPKIYDVFDVVLREGATTNYIPNRPFDVVGVFHIRPEAEDGKLYRLYEMEDATVITK
jgi:hypothetical protein